MESSRRRGIHLAVAFARSNSRIWQCKDDLLIIDLASKVDQLTQSRELCVEGVSDGVHSKACNAAISILPEATTDFVNWSNQIRPQSNLDGNGVTSTIVITTSPPP